MVALTTLTLWSLGQAPAVTRKDDASGRRSIRTSRGSIGKVPYGHSARNRSRLTIIEVGHRPDGLSGTRVSFGEPPR